MKDQPKKICPLKKVITAECDGVIECSLASNGRDMAKRIVYYMDNIGCLDNTELLKAERKIAIIEAMGELFKYIHPDSDPGKVIHSVLTDMVKDVNE
jgi:hypothetical protein